MFGYIKIEKDELKVKDYNLFKAYYCGVCQALKKDYGFPAQYFLSFDAAFLAIVLASVQTVSPRSRPIRCMANPLIRRPAAEEYPALSYAAAVNVLLVWFKLKDDWADNRSVKAVLLMPLMFGKKNKAMRRYPALYKDVSQALEALTVLEKQKCPQPDAAADAFGKLMAKIFDAKPAEGCDKQRILSHIGYLLGRFIYLLDAWKDRAEDEKKHAYNPFLIKGHPDREETALSLDYTLSELANSLALLEPVRNRAILENVVYLGLKKARDSVFSDKQYRDGAKEKRHERPL